MSQRPSWEAVDLLLKIAREATKGTTLDARLDAISDPLGALVPSASVSAVVAHPEQGPIAAWFRNGNPENVVDYATHYLPVDPMMVEGGKSPDGHPVWRLSDAVASSGRRYGVDAFTGEFLPRHRLKHIVGFLQPMPGGASLAFALHRETGTADFSSFEVECLKRAAQDISTAVRGSLLREHARGLANDAARFLSVVTDALGRPLEGEPAALELLVRLSRSEPGLARWLRDASATVGATPQECAEYDRLAETDDRELVKVRAFALESGDGVRRLLVLLEPLAPGTAALSDAIAVRARLTPRERLVAAAAVEGLGSREIAVRLGISVVTVGCHLTKVFSKTGTTGRNELTTLLLTGRRPGPPSPPRDR